MFISNLQVNYLGGGGYAICDPDLMLQYFYPQRTRGGRGEERALI